MIRDRNSGQRLWPDGERCADCKFWHGGDMPDHLHGFHEQDGECRRFPPNGPVREMTARGPRLSLPMVAYDDWCGEFRHIVSG